MKEESVVAIKKLPDGWTYWVRSERMANVNYKVQINWGSMRNTNPNENFEFDCSCPFSLKNVTVCKHIVYVLLDIGKR